MLTDQREWYTVQLPSWGLFYDHCPEGKVQITPWTTAEEELIVRHSGRAAELDALMNQLVEGNVKLPEGVAYGDLLITDRFFLLLQLRILSTVPLYTFQARCSNCERELPETTINMQKDLRIEALNDLEEDVHEPFSVSLPRSGVSVAVRLWRVRDEQKMKEYEQRVLAKMDDPGSPGYRYRLARQIVSIDGQSRKWDEKIDFVRRLPMLDNVVIQNTLEKYESGYDLTVELSCRYCREDFEVTLPINRHFFRPRQSDIERALAMDQADPTPNQLPREEGIRVERRADDVQPATEEVRPTQPGA